MRIKILVDQDEPIFFPLNGPRTLIGSSKLCDVILTVEGISRKHLVVLSENNHYFIIDQGSTNGTFLNEERLMPGRKVEFTSFFPLRLGDKTLISLMTEEESSEEEASGFNIPLPTASRFEKEESTRVMRSSDLKKISTESLIKKRQVVDSKRTIRPPQKDIKRSKPPKPKTSISSVLLQMFVFSFLGGAIYYSFFVKKSNEVVKVKKVGVVVTSIQKTTAVKDQAPVPEVLLSKEELVSYEKFKNLLGDIKCVTDQEKYLCQAIPGAKEEGWGVTQIGTMLNVMVDGTNLMEEAREYLMPPAEGFQEAHERFIQDQKEVAFALLVLSLPEDLNVKLLEDSKISIGLFTKTEEGFEPRAILAARPDALLKAAKILEPYYLENIKRTGTGALFSIRELYRVY